MLSTMIKGSAISLALMTSVSADTVMKFASWAPPSHVQNRVVIPTWGKWVEDVTQGRVKVEIEYGLGHPKTMFDLVEDGVADAGWSYHGYVPGRFKLTQIAELPLLGANAEAASVAHWRIHQKYLAQANEHEGLKVIGLFTHGPGQIHTAKPILSLGDLEGQKIRIGGGIQGIIGDRLGITAVGAPATKVYEMMQQGVIDGVFMSTDVQKSLRLKEVAPNLTLFPGGMYLGSFSLFINPDFLASLSAKDQQAILSVSGEKLSAMAGRAWDQSDIAGLNAAQEYGVNIQRVTTSDAMYKEFEQAIKGMDDEFIEMANQQDVDGTAALQELRQIAQSNL
ncbi:TRAP transporter substrate-binding protein [Amphritea sp. 2_MG-2023]|nr:TRAP transporter substrate-binding protein [Amphritea sp. 2_MG-2023]MBU2966597.1 TRAP transporter substrate-binding protein [Amphritea atlantica]MDO6417544.1 TRAP transporter substrate-binding protein [Amphritea sp. 2_MG-2023]